MATVTIKRTKKGRTITMKAGKGEDLRNVLYALSGEKPPEEEKTDGTSDSMASGQRPARD